MIFESPKYIYRTCGNGLVVPAIDLKENQKGVIFRVGLYNDGSGRYTGGNTARDIIYLNESGLRSDPHFMLKVERGTISERMKRMTLAQLNDEDLRSLQIFSGPVPAIIIPIEDLLELKELEIKLERENPNYRAANLGFTKEELAYIAGRK